MQGVGVGVSPSWAREGPACGRKAVPLAAARDALWTKFGVSVACNETGRPVVGAAGVAIGQRR